ncbi:MAG TPA: tRNA (adenosine(37)-N6)-threonylcarbamoyltransferase complex dimerization subunit type 1 TsaB [Candidatus Binatia bacterium]
MRILGIDTATSTASAALLENGVIIADEIRLQPGVGHAEIILPLLESVFAKAHASISDLNGIAVSIGPGSFTGLRVGLSTVKGLAYGGQFPVVGISTLLANAVRVADFYGLICSMLDARKQEVYASFFRRTSGALTRLTEDTIGSIHAVVDQARNLAHGESTLFIGEGAAVGRDALVGSLGAQVRFYSGDDYPSIASAVARMGEQRLLHSDGDFLGSMVPVYLRLSEAETKRRELG